MFQRNAESKKDYNYYLNKQEANIRKFKFYYRDKEIDIGKQYTYLGFTFTQSRKKQVGINNLINKETIKIKRDNYQVPEIVRVPGNKTNSKKKKKIYK